MIEFCLSTVLWTSVLMGLTAVGLNLIRALQVEEICRDAGRLYSAGLDFTQTGNQNLLLLLATGQNVTTTGGNGVFVFSTVEYIDRCSAPPADWEATVPVVRTWARTCSFNEL